MTDTMVEIKSPTGNFYFVYVNLLLESHLDVQYRRNTYMYIQI